MLTMTKAVNSIVDFYGNDSEVIEAQCHITNGLPAIVIIGYAQRAVDEAKDRLRASFASSRPLLHPTCFSSRFTSGGRCS